MEETGAGGERVAPHGTIHVIDVADGLEVHADPDTHQEDEAWLAGLLAGCRVESLPASSDDAGVRVWVINK